MQESTFYLREPIVPVKRAENPLPGLIRGVDLTAGARAEEVALVVLVGVHPVEVELAEAGRPVDSLTQ